ncbi:MAG: hypothetical protein R3C15_13450 [Thermoleophilia bacterium]
MARTVTRMVEPVSAPVSANVVPVAPPTSPQAPPPASQRCHWYEKENGDPVQAPVSAVRVLPSSKLPTTAGAAVLVGAAAAAGPAIASVPTATAASAPLLRVRRSMLPSSPGGDLLPGRRLA